MNKYIAGLGASLAIIMAGPASATGFTCTVNPTAYLGLSNSGLVATSVSGVGVQQICSINDMSAGVSAQVCTAWYASLLTWRAQNKMGTLFFDSNNPTVGGSTSCAQFTAWEFRVPYFLQLD